MIVYSHYFPLLIFCFYYAHFWFIRIWNEQSLLLKFSIHSMLSLLSDCFTALNVSCTLYAVSTLRLFPLLSMFSVLSLVVSTLWLFLCSRCFLLLHFLSLFTSFFLQNFLFISSFNSHFTFKFFSSSLFLFLFYYF